MNMWQVTAQEQASEGWSALFCTHMGCIQMQTPPHFFVEKRKLKRGVVRGQTLGFFPTSRTWRHRGQAWRLRGGVGETGGGGREVNRDEILLWLIIHFHVSKCFSCDESEIFSFYFLPQKGRTRTSSLSWGASPWSAPHRLPLQLSRQTQVQEHHLKSEKAKPLWLYGGTAEHFFSALCFLCCVMLARFIG